MNRVRSAKIAGQKWTLDFTPAYGQTLYAHNTIQIDGRYARKAPREFLDTVIHEILHASMKGAGERDVAEAARAISRILWRLGYRRKAAETCV